MIWPVYIVASSKTLPRLVVGKLEAMRLAAVIHKAHRRHCAKHGGPLRPFTVSRYSACNQQQLDYITFNILDKEVQI